MASRDYSFLSKEENDGQNNVRDYSFLSEEEPPKQKPKEPNPNGELLNSDGTPRASMSAYDPSLFEKAQNFFTGGETHKARASNERVARDIAKRDNVPVSDVYKSVGGARPDSEIDGPGRIQTAVGKIVQGAGSVFSSGLKGASVNRQATARDYISGVEGLLNDKEISGRSIIAVGGMATNIRDMKLAKESGDTETALRLKGVINQSIDDAKQFITADPKKESLYKLGSTIDEKIKNLIKTNPEFENDFFTSKVPSGLGSMISFAGVAALGKGALLKAGLPSLIAGTAPVAAAGGIVQYTAGFEDALASGADFETALKSAEQNIPLGFTEAIPIANLFNRLDKGSGGLLKRAVVNALKSGTEEGFQEAFQTVMSNAIAQKLYDKDRGLWASSGDGAGVGFTTGAIVAFLGTMIAGRRSKKIPQDKQSTSSLSKEPEQVNTPDQTGQPTELFNPTHKAGGGTDVQVATKNGRIIPDTYIDGSGNTIRDANAVPNNPDESVNVENDVSAVVASIKAEIAGKQTSQEVVSAPEQQANDVIASLEQQNQQAIDSTFAAAAPEVANQQTMNELSFGKTQEQLSQNVADTTLPTAEQQGAAPEIPVAQPELDQTKIDNFGQQAEPVASETVQPVLEEIKAEPQKPKRLEPKSKADDLQPVVPDITKAETLKPSEILKYSTDKPRLSAQKMSDLTKSIQDKGITRPAILLKNKKGKVTLEDGHHITRIADELGLDVPVKVIEQKKYETDVQVASRVLDAVEATSIKTEPVGETTANIEKVSNEASTSLKNDLPQPTEAQIESGNYKKAHVKVQGLDITIENPKGSKREGIDPNGQKWSVTMSSAYGYFKGTTGADSTKGATGNKIEQLDTYIGNSPESQEVFIVNQQDPDTGKFDELKVIVGTENINDAMGIYYGGFSDGTGGSRAKSVYQVPMAEFKELLNKGLGAKEIDKTSLLKKISPLKLKKLARETGADKLITPSLKSKEVPKNETLQTESKGNAVQEKTPTQTKGTNKLSNEGTQQSPNVDSYRAMRGKEISYEVETEDTGETFTVTVDAGTVMNELDTRLDSLQKLRDCI